MKRKLLTFACIITAAISAFGLAACGETEGDVGDHTHEPSDWIIERAATCSESGYRYKECIVCSQQMASETIPMLEHTESDWIIESPATCDRSGHKYKECTVCFQTVGSEEIPMLEHTESDWIVESPATCTESGYRYKQCTVCFQQMASEEIPVASHALQHFYYAEPTATNSGNCEYWHCSTCDTNFSDENAEEICWDTELRPYLEFTLSEDETYYIVSGNNIESAIAVEIPAAYDSLPVSMIATDAFWNCPATSVVIPESVITIADSAFASCGITAVVIPNSVETIGGNAFYGCDELTELTIGGSVNYIGAYAFRGCEKLSAVNYNCVELIDNTVYDVSPFIGCGVETDGFVLNIGKQVKTIPIKLCYTDRYFEDVNIKEVRFEEGGVCDSISYSAFSRSPLTSVELPDSIKTIGVQAFADCENLIEIGMPGVQTIEGSAFFGCTSLSSVKIGEKIENVGSMVFEECEALNTQAYSNALYLGNDEKPYSVLLKAENTEIQTVTIHPDTKVISPGAFEWCTWLTGTITIPNGVVSANQCFPYCPNIGCVEIPASVKSFTASWVSRSPYYTVDASSDYYKSVNGSLYSKDGKTLVSYYCGDSNDSALHVISEEVENIAIFAILINGAHEVVLPDALKYADGSSVSAPYGGKAYYKGTQEEWLSMTETLYMSDYVYCYSENEPALNENGTAYDGNYWHYDTDGTTPVVWTKGE